MSSETPAVDHRCLTRRSTGRASSAPVTVDVGPLCHMRNLSAVVFPFSAVPPAPTIGLGRSSHPKLTSPSLEAAN